MQLSKKNETHKKESLLERMISSGWLFVIYVITILIISYLGVNKAYEQLDVEDYKGVFNTVIGFSFLQLLILMFYKLLKRM